MKKNYSIPAVIILITVFCTMCKGTDEGKMEGFDWLLGKWKRTNEKQGMETYENWEKTNDSLYEGIGFTMMHGDTVKEERIRIAKKNESWGLMVKVPEEKEWVPFELSTMSDSTFSFKNETIDFPKLITYRKAGERTLAEVSGDGMEIDFEFVRME